MSDKSGRKSEENPVIEVDGGLGPHIGAGENGLDGSEGRPPQGCPFFGPEIGASLIPTGTRAILDAGSPGLISTMFSIDDEAAAALMAEFYRLLLGDTPVAEALQQAQLSLARPALPGSQLLGGVQPGGRSARDMEASIRSGFQGGTKNR